MASKFYSSVLLLAYKYLVQVVQTNCSQNSEINISPQIIFPTSYNEPYNQSFPNMYKTWGLICEKISYNLFKGPQNMCFLAVFSRHYLSIFHFGPVFEGQ